MLAEEIKKDEELEIDENAAEKIEADPDPPNGPDPEPPGEPPEP